MGLDWMVERKPREGKEEEYTEVKRRLDCLYNKVGANVKDHDALSVELEKLSQSPAETVGCPVLGVDKEADDWFHGVWERNQEEARKAVEEKNGRLDRFVAFWNRPFEEVLKEEKGKYVLELAKIKGGEGKITGLLSGGLSFRGKVIGYIDFLDEDLKNEAYADHTAKDSLEYADRLEKALLQEQKRKPRKSTVDGQERGHQLEELQWAIDFLRFWGKLGHGFYVWY